MKKRQTICSRVILIAACALLAGAVNAQVLRTGHPETYVVQRGDTLWDISARFLEDPWLWPEIWHINEQVANPHLIYPGDVLRLIYVNGKPQLVLDRGEVKLSPQIRETARPQAIASIPLDAIRDFFSKNQVVTEEHLESAPYMVAGPDGRIMVGMGDPLYARGSSEPGVNVYGIFSSSEEYRDPETGDLLGVRAEAKGTARFMSSSSDVMRLNVLESYAEISLGDRFFPLEQDQLDPQIFPAVPENILFGEIISVEGGVSQISSYDVVAINRGRDSDLEVGHLLAIMEEGEVVRDRVEGGTVRLPDEQAGVLMVFKIYERMSFGLVLSADKVLSVGYPVTSLFSQQAYEEHRMEEIQRRSERGTLFDVKMPKIFKPISEMFDPGTRPSE